MTVKIFGILFIIVIISALVALFIIAKRIAKRNNISVWKALFIEVGKNDENRNHTKNHTNKDWQDDLIFNSANKNNIMNIYHNLYHNHNNYD